MHSILDSIKKMHGISPEDTSFDHDLIIHINSALKKLRRLGVGPSTGFYIEDSSTTWEDLIPDRDLAELVKSFVYIKVKLVFDPPASPTVVDALNAAARDDEWEIVEIVEGRI